MNGLLSALLACSSFLVAAPLPQVGVSGKSLDEWAAALESSRLTDRKMAAMMISRMGPSASPVADRVIGALKEEFPLVPEPLVRALAKIPPPPEKAIPAVLKLLASETDEKVQVAGL